MIGLGNPSTAWATEPEPAAIEIIGADSIVVKLSGDASVTYTATVKDQNGNAMAAQTVTWLLKEAVSGVSIAAENGMVTVADTTVAESFTIVAASATDANVKAEKTVTLTQEENEPPVTVEVTYTAIGAITTIAPDTVTFADGKFTVPTGVTGFTFKDGDKDMKATFAEEKWTVSEVVTEPTTYTVTVDNTVSGGIIVVDPAQGNMGEIITVTVTPDVSKQLVTDSFKYTADNGETYTEITATEGIYSFALPAANVTVTARFEDIRSGSAGWDGSVDVSWYNPTDTVFYIDSPAKLAGLAAIVNGIYNTGATVIGNQDYIVANVGGGTVAGSTNATWIYGADDFDGKTVYLTADLDMGGLYNSDTQTWSGPNYMPIGGQYCMTYEDGTTLIGASWNGTLNGQGHTVKNIYCSRHAGSLGYSMSQSIGLIGRMGVHDSDPTDWYATPAVKNVAVTGYIYGNRSIGGIVGKSGRSNGSVIENCINYASVSNTDSKGVGGIAGAGWNKLTIKNCANMGKIYTSYSNAGGISGSSEAKVYNSYNVGYVGANNANQAQSLGTNNGGAVWTNCYWLEGSSTSNQAVYGSTTGSTITKMDTEESMKTPDFLAALNGDGQKWVAGTNNINSGYPVPRAWGTDSAALTSVTKESDPARLSYVVGQTFDPTGLVIMANYSDGIQEMVTDYIISKTTPLGTADTLITVSGMAGGTAYSFDFPITVEASVEPAPVLSADTTDNNIGQPVNITFTDNETWRGAITEIKVDDTVLESSQYTKEVGRITIVADVFTEAKDYTISIKTTGYSDATVTQTLNEASLPSEVTYTATGAITAITPDTVTFANGKFTVPTGVSEFTFKDGDKEMKATFADDTWTFAEVTPPPTSCTVTFSVTGANGTLTATVDDTAINSGDEVEAGKSVVFTATPATGYQVKEWTVGDQAAADNKTNTLTVENLAADTTVTVGVQFANALGVTVTGGDTISADGIYSVAANATGTITIADGLTVTLVGSGTANPANRELFINCGPGVTLTIQDLCVTNSDEMNLLNFTGSGNKLLVAGVNVLEGIEYNSKAVIHVGPVAELTIDSADAEGTMYLYKYTAGAGIGGDIHEANGKLNFAGGNLFIKGSKTGAVIGNDTCGDAAKEAQIGDITISGGKIYIEANARGSAIGGSSMSAGGNVNMTGGMLAIYVDWTGSAIGAGAAERAEADAKCGNLVITGGSLKVFVNQNAAYDWGLTTALVCDNPITAAKLNALTGGAPVYRYMLDVSGIEADADGEYTVTVDGTPYYTGGLHDYEYTANQESTMANWTKTNADRHIYLYLTLGAHTVSVNGQDLGSIQVVEPDYSGDEVEIPEAQWSEAADTSWYTANPTATSFEIGTAAELAGLAALVNAGTDDFSGKTVTLTEDVNLSEREWTTIGRYDLDPVTGTPTGSAFSGAFDGGGNAITGLLLGDPDKRYQGLFGYVSGATLKNIIVAGGYITGYEYLGGIAGRAVDSAFTNCENRATVWAVYKSAGGNQRIGGNYCGGIVGNGENCTVASCQNNGSVGGLRYAAGIAGLFYGTITDCVNKHECLTLWEGVAGIAAVCGTMSVTPTDSCSATITNCRNEADLSGQIVAGIALNASLYSHLQISQCSNSGDLTGCKNGGGIINSLGGGDVVSQCFNSGDITATANSGTGIGGIVGLMGWGSKTEPGVVIDCYNTGAVANTGAMYTNAGGIVGHVNKGHQYYYMIENCYSTGAVSTQMAGTHAGGVAGYMTETNFGDVDIINNYYLAGSAPGGIAGEDPTDAGIQESSPVYMKSAEFLAALNGDGRRWVLVPDSNDGYPILRFQAADNSTITSITKESDPVRLSYVAGQSFDTAGLGIWANYSDGTREKITDYTINKTSGLEITDTSITVSGTYGGIEYSYDFPITVEANALTGISVTTPPANTSYSTGETFNPAGMVVTASYTNGFIADLASGEYTLSPGIETPLTLTDTAITVSYTYAGVTMTAEQAITVSTTKAPVQNAEGFYELTTAGHMLWLANQVNTGTDTAVKGKLMNDIDLSKVTWTPIGSSRTDQYAGTFDGNGSTVTLVLLVQDTPAAGLFGFINGASVKNLTVAGSVTLASSGAEQYAAGIAGHATVAVIEKCVNKATVTGASERADGVGGIVGYIAGGSPATTVTDCTNNGAVTAADRVGGIVGYASVGAISKCANTSAVTATGTSSDGVGGVVGFASSGGSVIIDQCYNTGAVTAADYVGGVAGWISMGSILENSYNTGRITSTSASGTTCTGGVVGRSSGSPVAGTVQNCYNAGLITVKNTGDYTAGVIGYAGGPYSSINASNNYYLNTTAAKGIGYLEDNAVSKTSEELKVLAPALGEFFKDGIGYPILAWQTDSGVPIYEKGDINGDGNINSQDVVLLRKHVANLSLLSGDRLSGADVNKDGAVNSQDIMKLRRYVANIITSLD